MNSMKRQNNRIPKEELLRSVGAQYGTGDQWRSNSRKNEEMEPKQKQHPTVDTSGESEVAQSCPTLSDPMDCSLPAPPSMGFSGQSYWSGLPFPSPLS